MSEKGDFQEVPPPSRRILNIADMDHWRKCPGYLEYSSFVKQLNESTKGVHDGFYNREKIESSPIVKVDQLLERLSTLVDQVKPFDDDQNQRFGNRAYRLWFGKMVEASGGFFEDNYSKASAAELLAYFQDSFGNQQRIDYGTGHEMNFIIFLLGLLKTDFTTSATQKDIKNVYQELLTLFAASYMPLVRKIQVIYCLEPAGSHGVFSLDDFQFLPFLFGSGQLIGHSSIEPKNFPEREVAESHSDRFMFHAAILHIHNVKNGPFAEHSNQLWNISGVEEWSKVNKGLLRMYNDEVLVKFPIVQHVLFGAVVMRW